MPVSSPHCFINHGFAHSECPGLLINSQLTSLVLGLFWLASIICITVGTQAHAHVLNSHQYLFRVSIIASEVNGVCLTQVLFHFYSQLIDDQEFWGGSLGGQLFLQVNPSADDPVLSISVALRYVCVFIPIH